MSFGFAVFLAAVATYLTIVVITFWLGIFKINIPGKIYIRVTLISCLFLWIAITAFILLAPEKLQVITLIVGIAITLLTCIATYIWNMMD